jgi:hypothetical protein
LPIAPHLFHSSTGAFSKCSRLPRSFASFYPHPVTANLSAMISTQEFTLR